MRIDFIAKDTHGECAMGFRTYINYKFIGFLKVLDIAEGYEIREKKGSFYFLYSMNVPDCYVHLDIENMELKIDRPLVSQIKGGD